MVIQRRLLLHQLQLQLIFLLKLQHSAWINKDLCFSINIQKHSNSYKELSKTIEDLLPKVKEQTKIEDNLNKQREQSLKQQDELDSIYKKSTYTIDDYQDVAKNLSSIQEKINDEQKSVQFQQEMLKKIKNI